MVLDTPTRPPTRPPARTRGRLRSAAAWTLTTVLLALLGGALAAGLGLVLGLWHVVRPPAPRTLLRAALAVLACVPPAWVVGNADRLGEVTPGLVTDNPWPGALAVVGVTLLVVGVVLDDRNGSAAGPTA